MTTPRELAGPQREAALRVAIERRLPLVLSIWNNDHWMMLNSRFVPRDPGSELLCIEPPGADAAEGVASPVELPVGTHVGVSFRRGHHKCLFSSSIVGQQRVVLTADVRVDALLLRRPERVQQLQRRAYVRARAPEEARIDVVLQAGGWNIPQRDKSVNGVMVDLSAGGVRVRFDAPPSESPLARQVFAVEIALPGGALRADALFRHSQLETSGAVTWGLQLVGMETTEGGRLALSRIAQLVRDWGD